MVQDDVFAVGGVPPAASLALFAEACSNTQPTFSRWEVVDGMKIANLQLFAMPSIACISVN
jgi:hypothetical protein